jgi:hypothetical protein
MGLSDWQLSVNGGPARDLAYAFTTHLPVETRRLREHALMDRYLDKLDEAVVKTDLTAEELFVGYRQQVCYEMLAWLATVGRGALQPRYQPDDISLANLERITQAFEDLDTLGAVGA